MSDLRDRIARIIFAGPASRPYPVTRRQAQVLADNILALPELAPLRAEERALILTALRDRENVADAKEFETINRIYDHINAISERGASDGS